MPRTSRSLALALCAATAFPAVAQTAQTRTPPPSSAVDTGNFHYRPDRQVVVYENGRLLIQEGGWYESDHLRQYAAAHSSLSGGNFILFQDGESRIHEIVNHELVASVQATYAPMKALNAQQSALREQQKPLAAQQQALAAEMQAAATPAQMASIGREQGRIGHLQGQIGHEQGRIGQQQGTVGRVSYNQMQSLIDVCLRDGSCPVLDEGRSGS